MSDGRTAVIVQEEQARSAYGLWLDFDKPDIEKWSAMVAEAGNGAEVRISIDGVAREMTFAEFRSRLGFDAE